jgi:hypothetical protein
MTRSSIVTESKRKSIETRQRIAGGYHVIIVLVMLHGAPRRGWNLFSRANS